MLTTLILTALACLLVYHFVAPETRTSRRGNKYCRDSQKLNSANKTDVEPRTDDNGLKMPDYYEQIVEKDKLKRTYLNLHESL